MINLTDEEYTFIADTVIEVSGGVDCSRNTMVEVIRKLNSENKLVAFLKTQKFADKLFEEFPSMKANYLKDPITNIRAIRETVKLLEEESANTKQSYYNKYDYRY